MVRRINLLPPEARRRTQTSYGNLVLVAVCVLVVGGMALGYLHFQGALTDRQAELAQLDLEKQQLTVQLAAMQRYEDLQQQVAALETLVQQIYASRTLVSEIYGDMSLVVPTRVSFSSADITAPKVTAELSQKGATTKAKAVPATPEGSLKISGEYLEFTDVADLLIRLQAVPALRNVELLRAEQGNEQEPGSFEVGGAVVNTQPAGTPLPLSQVGVRPQ